MKGRVELATSGSFSERFCRSLSSRVHAMVTRGLTTSRMFPPRSSLAGLIVMLAIIAGLLAVSVGSQSGGLGKGGAGIALLSLRSAKRQQPELIASGARQQIQ